jgi:hypothetical protein
MLVPNISDSRRASPTFNCSRGLSGVSLNAGSPKEISSFDIACSLLHILLGEEAEGSRRPILNRKYRTEESVEPVSRGECRTREFALISFAGSSRQGKYPISIKNWWSEKSDTESSIGAHDEYVNDPERGTS